MSSFNENGRKLKDRLKGELNVSFLRLKMIIKDRYIHHFALGILMFSLLFVVALLRRINGYDIHNGFLRVFFAGLLTSMVMLTFRELYLFWFKKIDFPEESSSQLSHKHIISDFCDSYAPASFKNLMRKISGLFGRVESKYSNSSLSCFIDKLDMNYLCWVVLFIACLL